MSRYDYEISKDIDYPFYALIMAAMRKADSFNLTNCVPKDMGRASG